MSAVLRLPEGLFDELTSHLLPPRSEREEAAFLFVRPVEGQNGTFEVVDCDKLSSGDFDCQFGDYLELADDARARLIKRAHDLDASLVEMHSHPGPYPAAFSFADRRGLSETVPYMWWRLKKRPYFAIVVAPTGFDALAWLTDPGRPEPLGAIQTGDRLLRPTNNSLRGWQ
jgi:proteasome lid subunit RPN8/RPN11